jgi:hypothetical protein
MGSDSESGIHLNFPLKETGCRNRIISDWNNMIGKKHTYSRSESVIDCTRYLEAFWSFVKVGNRWLILGRRVQF